MSEFKCFEANPIYFEAQCNLPNQLSTGAQTQQEQKADAGAGCECGT